MKKILGMILCMGMIILSGCSSKSPVQGFIPFNDTYSYKGSTLFWEKVRPLGEVNISKLSTFTYTENTQQQILKYLPNIQTNLQWKSIVETDRTGSPSASYITDGTKIFFEDHEVIGVDAPSFTPLFSIYAVDKNSIYINGKKMPINKDSFSIIENTLFYSTDGVNVYGGNEKIITADPKTFIADPGTTGLNGFAHDNKNNYYMGKIYSGNNSFPQQASGVTVEVVKDDN